jgi:glycerate kinase
VRILVAPDKFKGVLNAREVAENIAAGLRAALPDAKIDIMPVADGGEGIAQIICDALGGSWANCRAHDPVGREIEARYASIESGERAVIEMSEAAGMWRLRPNERDVAEPADGGQLLQQKLHASRNEIDRRSWATQPIDPIGCPPGAMRVDLASTFGVGEMILDAARNGAKEIIVGLGGSATNDGGFGMARALGFRFFAQDHELTGPVSELSKLTRIAVPGAAGVSPAKSSASQPARLPPQLRIVAAADVRNPLLGENGATRVFGPQKGVTEDKVDIFERALAKLAAVVAREFGVDHRDEAGVGAAGGLGFGLISFCGAIIRPGFDVVAEAVGLEAKMQDVDLVITGEGSLDRQTLEGKTPAGVARMARQYRKRVFAIAGRASEDRQLQALFDGVYVVTPPGMNEEEAVARAAELLQEKARELGKILSAE